MSKNITSLRNHLFDTLNRLADATQEDIDLEVNKSIHIVNVAEAIIKTAEVENTFVALTKGTGSGFIPLLDAPNPQDVETYKRKMFEVDKEKNWLMNDSKSTSNTGIPKHEFGNNQSE